jgi:hypothetical protein
VTAVTRRAFVERTAGAVGGLAAAGLGWPVAAAVAAPAAPSSAQLATFEALVATTSTWEPAGAVRRLRRYLADRPAADRDALLQALDEVERRAGPAGFAAGSRAHRRGTLRALADMGSRPLPDGRVRPGVVPPAIARQAERTRAAARANPGASAPPSPAGRPAVPWEGAAHPAKEPSGDAQRVRIAARAARLVESSAPDDGRGSRQAVTF